MQNLAFNHWCRDHRWALNVQNHFREKSEHRNLELLFPVASLSGSALLESPVKSDLSLF